MAKLTGARLRLGANGVSKVYRGSAQLWSAPGTATLASPATSITATGFTSAWTVGADTADVLVQRRTPGGTFATVATVASSTLTYAHTGLTASTAYEVQVIPRNGSTVGTASNVVTTSTAAAVTVLHAQDWDGTNGTGIAGWRARAVNSATRATGLVLDTSVDAGGGTTAGSLKWTLNAAGASAVELAGTVAVTAGSTVTLTLKVRNGDTVAQSAQASLDEFNAAGDYITTTFGSAVSVAVGTFGTVTVTKVITDTSTQVRLGALVNEGGAAAAFHVDNVRVTVP